MPLFALSEHPIQQPSGARQSHVPTMQRSQRPSNDVGLLMNQYAARLSICRRSKKKVLNLIEGDTNVRENCGAGVWN